MTGGDDERDGGAEDATVGAKCERGLVVVFGEMGEADPAQAVASRLTDEVGGFEVGEMSALAADAVLEEWGVGPVFEHGGIIVAFDEEGVEIGDGVCESGEDVTEVGEDAETFCVGFEDEADAVGTIVRGGDGVDPEFSELEGVAGGEMRDRA